MSHREKILLMGGVTLIACGLTFWVWPEFHNQSNLPSDARQSIHDPPLPQSGLALNVSEAKRTMKLKNPRNIFAPLKHPVETKTGSVSAEATPKTPEPPPSPTVLSPNPSVATGPSPAELVTKQAERDMRQFTFLGYLTKEGVRQGFLSKDETIYIVKQGETLGESITIQSLDDTEIVLSKHIKLTGKTVEATLPLTRNDAS